MGKDAIQPGGRLGSANRTRINEPFSLKTNLRRWWDLFVYFLTGRGSGAAWGKGQLGVAGAEVRSPVPDPSHSRAENDPKCRGPWPGAAACTPCGLGECGFPGVPLPHGSVLTGVRWGEGRPVSDPSPGAGEGETHWPGCQDLESWEGQGATRWGWGQGRRPRAAGRRGQAAGASKPSLCSLTWKPHLGTSCGLVPQPLQTAFWAPTTPSFAPRPPSTNSPRTAASAHTHSGRGPPPAGRWRGAHQPGAASPSAWRVPGTHPLAASTALGQPDRHLLPTEREIPPQMADTE